MGKGGHLAPLVIWLRPFKMWGTRSDWKFATGYIFQQHQLQILFCIMKPMCL